MFQGRCGHRHDDRRYAYEDFWHGGRRGRGAGHPREGRLGRLFEHGDLRLVLLDLIVDKPRHGYEIIKAIEERTNGAYSPSPGTIYPALTMLEEQGYLTVEPGEGSKKPYAATEEGKACLQRNRGIVDAVLARMDRAGAAEGGRSSPPIIRATENLRMALRLRLSRGPLTDQQISALAETLDRAAIEIERI